MSGAGGGPAVASAPSLSSWRRIVAATYNIHRCVGLDGRYSPSRIADVLEEVGADVIGLQEVDTGLFAAGGRDQLSFLAGRLGFHVAAGLNIVQRRGSYGNALLSRWPIPCSRLIDLTAPGREPRGAIDAEIALPGAELDPPLRVIVTHFGLRAWERRRQMAALIDYLGSGADRGPLLVMGDFNEWVRFGPVSRGLGAVLGCAPQVTTFPARWPLLPLDRICSRSLAFAGKPSRHVSAASRLASDHLPVKAAFSLPAAASSSPSVVQVSGSPSCDHNLI